MCTVYVQRTAQTHRKVGQSMPSICRNASEVAPNTQEGGVDAEQNVVLISIASVADPAMAPAGKHCLHAYLPATEPFSLWKGICWHTLNPKT